MYDQPKKTHPGQYSPTGHLIRLLGVHGGGVLGRFSRIEDDEDEKGDSCWFGRISPGSLPYFVPCENQLHQNRFDLIT